MPTNNRPRIDGLDAITVRSPAQFGDEAKDQDRVLWSPAMATACICDGVISSPSSEKAAEIASRFSPVLFKDGDHLEDNLRALADLLVVHRLESQQMPVKTSPSASKAMRAMLQEVARENLARSFQTTLVAVGFVPTDDVILVSIVCVGDSAFFAFSADGDLLATSLPYRAQGNKAMRCDRATLSPPTLGIRFIAGDEILVKVVCDASERPSLAKRARLRVGSTGNWLVCVPLDQAGKRPARKNKPRPDQAEDAMLWLGPDDLLLVPKYLAEMPRDPRYRRYCRVRYSQAVRILKSASNRQLALQDKSSATAVLPDHFYVGGWSSFRERFPRDGQFVLASDGFYSCFSHPKELWRWLNANKADLSDKRKQSIVLEQLHRRLYSKAGDDDISFVWVFDSTGPNVPDINGGADNAR